MAPDEFFFALALSGDTSREMLNELSGRVFERLGGSGAGGGAAALGDQIYAAVAGAGAKGTPGEIDVQFHGGAGRLLVIVSSRSGEIWRATRDIP